MDITGLPKLFSVVFIPFSDLWWFIAESTALQSFVKVFPSFSSRHSPCVHYTFQAGHYEMRFLKSACLPSMLMRSLSLPHFFEGNFRFSNQISQIYLVGLKSPRSDSSGSGSGIFQITATFSWDNWDFFFLTCGCSSCSSCSCSPGWWFGTSIL